MDVKKKYLLPFKYTIIGITWSLLTIHLGYLYISSFSSQSLVKGGTYVEATTSNFTYLPYNNQDTQHLIAQTLLYRGCLLPSFSGSEILYSNDLCNISTKNNKKFIITITPDLSRSDGTPISLEDVYFTYKTLLKDNFWNIPSHESYKNINIDAFLDRLEVSFPYASIDNNSFFVNPILPVHAVANISLAEYRDKFSKYPIVSSCANIVSQIKDEKSLIIDLTNCPQYPHKFYQLKQFENRQMLDAYISTRKGDIDVIIDQNSKDGYTGYFEQSLITQNFLVSFFNEQKSLLSLQSKQYILALFQQVASMIPSTFVTDSYIFPQFSNITGITQSLIQDQVQPKYLPTNIPAIMLFSGSYHQSYSINQKISETIATTIILPKSYEKITLRHNNEEEIIISSFNPSNNSAQYEFSEILRNINLGYNEYSIQGYNNNLQQDVYYFSVFYGPRSGSVMQPTFNGSGELQSGLQTPLTNLPKEYIQPIYVLYYDKEPLSEYMLHLKKELENYNLHNFFKLEGIQEQSLYEGKLQTKDYDIVVSTLSLGLRKDISNIFLSDIPSLNPSLYINQSLSNEISNYFLSKGSSKQTLLESIHKIYNQAIPLGFIAKTKQQFYSNNSGEVTPMRMPHIGRRNEFIRNYKSNTSVKSIDRNTALSLSGFNKFLKSLVD